MGVCLGRACRPRHTHCLAELLLVCSTSQPRFGSVAPSHYTNVRLRLVRTEILSARRIGCAYLHIAEQHRTKTVRSFTVAALLCRNAKLNQPSSHSGNAEALRSIFCVDRRNGRLACFIPTVYFRNQERGPGLRLIARLACLHAPGEHRPLCPSLSGSPIELSPSTTL